MHLAAVPRVPPPEDLPYQEGSLLLVKAPPILNSGQLVILVIGFVMSATDLEKVRVLVLESEKGILRKWSIGLIADQLKAKQATVLVY